MQKLKKLFSKKMMYWSIIGVLAIGGIVYFCNHYIEGFNDKCFITIENLPQNDVALVLGTGKLIKGKYVNRYYKFRIETAAELYHSGKVKHLLLSGDNSRKDYDEPSDMKVDLLKKGIPESAITLDYAGFRTLDSVVRCKEIFGQNKITIVSQKFHNERALFLAEQYDIQAVAINAKMPSVRKKVLAREYLARVKAVLDVFVFGVEPKFLGNKEVIEVS